MKWTIWIPIFASLLFLGYQQLSSKSSKPTIPENGYFGKGESKEDDTKIYPFQINVSDAQLKDLKDRLRNARITHEDLEDVPNFTYGFNVKALLKFKDYWINEYNWKKEEKLINSFNHFTTQIEGLNIHFVHAKPPSNTYKRTVQILISHGWPGSFHEFIKIIPMLTDPQKHLGLNIDLAFEVIAPSIPGFGFSEASHKKGMNQASVARIFNKLATRVGFKKYIAQGGDWGAIITSQLARLYPDRLHGLHLNMMSIPYTDPKYVVRAIIGSFFPKLMFDSPEFHDFSFKRIMLNLLQESGYYHIQATKPDTIGVGLNDSPIGLLAYILQIVSTATNPKYRELEDGGLEREFTKDELLTFVMVYWINGNMLQAQRLYKEGFEDENNRLLMREYVHISTGYAALETDAIPPQPLELAKLNYNITHYTYIKGCGHFGAFEKPRELATDIFDFARKVII